MAKKKLTTAVKLTPTILHMYAKELAVFPEEASKTLVSDRFPYIQKTGYTLRFCTFPSLNAHIISIRA